MVKSLLLDIYIIEELNFKIKFVLKNFNKILIFEVKKLAI